MNGESNAVTYESADDAYFSVLEKYASELFKVHKKSKYPQTYRAMLSFVVKLNSLKNAMFDMVETNNPYAFNAILRCFFDHHLKLSYIFFRFLIENTDDVGREYYESCGAHEFREYVAAMRAAHNIVGVEGEDELHRMFEQTYPNAGKDKHLAETSAKFKYRAIIRYIAGAAPGIVSMQRPFLAKIIPRFAELSAFVHGGPHGDDEMATYASPEAIEECKKELDLALAMTMSALLFAGMAISREFNEYQGLTRDVNQVLRAWMEAP